MAQINHYFVILCGGTGPRLWPLSHADYPKQFLKIFGKKTLLEQTIDNAKKVCSTKNIIIVSNQRYQEEIKTITHNKIPSENLFFEPLKKNTAMAITFAVSQIYQRDPNAIITTSPSDYYIQKTSKFKKNISFAYSLAQKQHKIVTIGIKATNPNPAFGYIVPQQKGHGFSSVSFFIEKPETSIAEKLIKKNSLWNSDIHTFSVNTFLDELKKFQPEYYEFFERITKNPKEVEAVYKKSPKLNINQAISEKSKDMLVIPAEFTWSDVGEWKSIYQNLPHDKEGISTIKSYTEIVNFDSKNCLVHGPRKKLIGLVGVNNLAIIDTPDSLLICNLDRSFNVRDLITTIVSKKKTKGYFLKK